MAKKTKQKSTVPVTPEEPVLDPAALQQIQEEIAGLYGDLTAVLDTRDSFFPSGSLVLDSVLSDGKGIPLGKFISINSESGVGKSSVALHIARHCCAQGHRVLYLDTEVGLNINQLDSFSITQFVHTGLFIPKHIRTYRELDEIMAAALQDPKLRFVFLDSLTDVLPEELANSNIADVNRPGLDAAAQAMILRKYKCLYNQHSKTMVFILQNRTRIGMNFGQRTTVQASGGKAVMYHMDITLELVRKRTLTKKVKGHPDAIPYGSDCIVRSTKNRYAPPMIPMPLQVIFGKGVSNAGAISQALLLNGVVHMPNARTYIIDYQGTEQKLTSKLAFDEFIKKHILYYKNIVDQLGGIRLLRQEPSEEEVAAGALEAAPAVDAAEALTDEDEVEILDLS